MLSHRLSNNPILLTSDVHCKCFDVTLTKCLNMNLSLAAKVGTMFWKARITSQCSYRSWQVTGILTIFVLQRFFDVIVVLVTSLVLLAVAIVTYFILEIKLRLDRNNEHHAGDNNINLTSLDEGGWIPKLNPHARNQRTSLVTMNAQ